jgi:outer membrane immunogenic protein
MRCVVIVGAGLLSIVGFVAAASAADLPAATYSKAPAIVDPAYDWTGFYVGVEGGGGWSRDQRTYLAPNPPNGALINERLAGGLAGGLIGYNWQLPGKQFLLGIEGSFDWADINGSTPLPEPRLCLWRKAQTALLRDRADWIYLGRRVALRQGRLCLDGD